MPLGYPRARFLPLPSCSAMGHMGAAEDPFLMVVHYAPLAFIIAGVLVVVWLSRQRLPYEWQSDVLAALSDTEALPPCTIRERPPLADQNLDLKTLITVLDTLCTDGRVVRWYSDGVDGPAAERQPVYRRVGAWPSYVSARR